MLIAIPSKGRPMIGKSAKTLRGAVLFVPAAEAEGYGRGHPGREVVPVPDDVRGITRTRNWILDYAAARGERWVVMVDDDLRAAGWIELGHARGRHRRLSPAAWEAEFVRLFEVTEGIGFRVWGLKTESAIRSTYPYRPFVFHTYLTASCLGILNDGRTRFDESFPVKEDYELGLRLIREDGGILGVRYLYWENDHWTREGGCKSYRTQAVEEAAIRRLIAMYPGLIRRVRRGGSEYSIEIEF